MVVRIAGLQGKHLASRLRSARAGLGAGVVPIGRLRHIPADAVYTEPFGDPPIFRRVVMTERRNNPPSDLSRIDYAELKHLAATIGANDVAT